MAAWPIREGLLHLLERRRERALENFRFDFIQWCLTAPYIERKKRPKAPQLPDILKDTRSAKK